MLVNSTHKTLRPGGFAGSKGRGPIVLGRMLLVRWESLAWERSRDRAFAAAKLQLRRGMLRGGHGGWSRAASVPPELG